MKKLSCLTAAALGMLCGGAMGAAELPETIFSTYPVVYAVGDEYQILVPVKQETLMWCEVNGNEYYDESCGILRSATTTHRMTVPMKDLDDAGHYTICYREVEERLPYFSKTSEVNKLEFSFRPVRGDDIRIFHIADAHNRIDAPVAAAGYFGADLDLLILNGDIPEDSGDIQNFTTIHAIAGNISKGEIPVVFSRGNHDLRGIYAEKLAEHTPTLNGNSYFTFRLGPVWGIVLDCGEDKPDDHPEYGNTMACHAFRQRETAFLKQVIADAGNEYAAPGVEYRLVVSHVPFSQVLKPPFDIEQELYREWCRLLAENVHPQLMLSGHIHDLYITHVGDELDHLGQPCPVVVGSLPGKDRSQFTGAAVALTPGRAEVRFVNQDRQVVGEEALQLIP